jgi:O-antigen ligase
MTRAISILPFAACALLSFMALYLIAPFHSKATVLVVLVAPLFLAFILPPAVCAAARNAAETASSFTWWHWLVLLALMSAQVFRIEYREVSDINSNPLDGWALFRVAASGFVAFVLIARLLSEKTPWLRNVFRGLFSLLAIFVVISLLSTMWSVRPLWTLYKSFEYGFDIVLVVAIFVSVKSVHEYEKLLNWVWTLLGLLVVVALVEAAIDPADAFLYGGEKRVFPIPELTGVFPHQSANGLGTYGAILALVALSRLMLRNEDTVNRGGYRALLFFGIMTMFMSECRSAFLGFALGGTLLLILTGRASKGMIVAGCGAIFATMTGFDKLVSVYLQRGQYANEMASLTGRIEWWQVAWTKILERPLLGWGAFAGGRFIVMPMLNHSTSPDVDSSIVEPLLDTGVLGLFFLLLALGFAWRYLYKGIKSQGMQSGEKVIALECMAVLALLTVRCFFVNNLTAHPALPFLIVIGYAEFVRRRLKFAH